MPREVVVGGYESEMEAETAAGYLRSLGLSSRVAYRASSGVPRQASPIRVMAPFGEYEVRVPEDEAARAREALAPIGGSERPRRFRWLGWVLIVAMLLPLLIQAVLSLRLR